MFYGQVPPPKFKEQINSILYNLYQSIDTNKLLSNSFFPHCIINIIARTLWGEWSPKCINIHILHTNFISEYRGGHSKYNLRKSNKSMCWKDSILWSKRAYSRNRLLLILFWKILAINSKVNNRKFLWVCITVCPCVCIKYTMSHQMKTKRRLCYLILLNQTLDMPTHGKEAEGSPNKGKYRNQ